MDDVPAILKLPPDVRTYSAAQVDELIKEVTHTTKTGLQLQTPHIGHIFSGTVSSLCLIRTNQHIKSFL